MVVIFFMKTFLILYFWVETVLFISPIIDNTKQKILLKKTITEYKIAIVENIF